MGRGLQTWGNERVGVGRSEVRGGQAQVTKGMLAVEARVDFVLRGMGKILEGFLTVVLFV